MTEVDPTAPDEILEFLFEQEESGARPALREVEERFPNRLPDARQAYRELCGYQRLRESARVQAQPTRIQIEPGRRLGDFEVVGELSRGGMGVVYRARQRSLGEREVALKVGLAGEPGSEIVERFRDEAFTLANFSHPGLAEVYGFGEEDGLIFFAMRLVEGPDLSTVLARMAQSADDPLGPKKLRRLVRVFAQVARALREVHAHDLVHRDVKPANIVLEGAFLDAPLETVKRAVLVDFGLVRKSGGIAPESGHPTSLVTREYASPEQIFGRALDASADVFSLGASLHDLIAAGLPQDRPPAAAGLEPLSQIRADVPPELEAIVAKACHRDSEQRYAHGGELADDLEAWLAQREVSACPWPWWRRARSAIAGHPRILLGVAVAFVLVAVLGRLGWMASLWADSATRLRSAWALSDPLAMERALDAVPTAVSALPGFLPADAREVVARLRAAELDDPLTPVLSALRDERPDRSLLSAATSLRQLGLGGDLFLQRYFLEWLRGPTDALAPPVRNQAFLLLGRVLFERPATVPEEHAAAAAYRERAVQLWKDPRVEGESRLYLMTALSGCGGPDEIERLLRWSQDPGASLEELRLGYQCVAAIIRRGHACGYLDRLDLDGIEGLIEPVARSGFECEATGKHLPGPMRMALQDMTMTVAFARRARGEVSGIPGWIDAGQLRGGFEREAWKSMMARVLAASGDDRVRPWLLGDGLPLEPDVVRPWDWGYAAGASGDTELCNRARAICVASQGVDGGVDFDFGHSSAELARRGLLPEHLPDRNSLLGHRLQEGESAVRSWSFVPALGSRLAVVRIDPTGLLAEGSFERLSARHADLYSDHLRLFAFGRSEVEASFLLPMSADFGDVTIEVEQQAAHRGLLPYLGRSVLELRLNGNLMNGSLGVSSGSVHTIRLVASPDLLETSLGSESKRQVLSLRLLESTTTTYWLRCLRISW